ncbi:xanthine dehydrogenase accessory factor [Rhizobium subbaraonis]|uniref:Xanthine dehydrogenase accessory factor n=1 Tax=Rhizobium subbaraonis TaxID=908946 RepID=A0A285U636_9HYPH|nr:xanthine dehydrogenase accessory factor [Rhizobium subbaraonis]
MRKPNIDQIAEGLKRAGTPYVMATVVRTVAATAAKAGAKAVILEDGTIAEGWIGGGCARGAVLRAAREAIADGEPRLVSVQPEDLLAELGVSPGEMRDGVRFARNMCPSKGSMDVFVEPVLPVPHLYVLGASPVGVALADLARRFGFHTVACAPASDQQAFPEVDDRIEGYLLPADAPGERYLVVATQGRGDEAALRAALGSPAAHIAFVGSRAKAASLKQKLRSSGVRTEDLDRVKAPAGLDIGAVTPEEIALSIVAELVEVRRRHHRGILRAGTEARGTVAHNAPAEAGDVAVPVSSAGAGGPGTLRRALAFVGERLLGARKKPSEMPDAENGQDEAFYLGLLLQRRFCCM